MGWAVADDYLESNDLDVYYLVVIARAPVALVLLASSGRR
jgi:hypothetical protein